MYQFRLRSLFWLTTLMALLAAAIAANVQRNRTNNRWAGVVVPTSPPVSVTVIPRGQSQPDETEQSRHPMVIPVDPSIDPNMVLKPQNVDPNMPMNRRSSR
jgi:hypothetical protein